jgi:hypothetical protein
VSLASPSRSCAVVLVCTHTRNSSMKSTCISSTAVLVRKVHTVCRWQLASSRLDYGAGAGYSIGSSRTRTLTQDTCHPARALPQLKSLPSSGLQFRCRKTWHVAAAMEAMQQQQVCKKDMVSLPWHVMCRLCLHTCGGS